MLTILKGGDGVKPTDQIAAGKLLLEIGQEGVGVSANIENLWDALNPKNRPSTVETNRAVLLDYLRANPAGVRRDQAVRECHISRHTLDRLFPQLVDAGLAYAEGECTTRLWYATPPKSALERPDDDIRVIPPGSTEPSLDGATGTVN